MLLTSLLSAFVFAGGCTADATPEAAIALAGIQDPTPPAKPTPKVDPAVGNQDPKPKPQGKPTDKPADKPVQKPAEGKPDDDKVPSEDDIVIPESADPADIRAIRAANQMIAAERRLQKLLKDGELKGLEKILTFDELTDWPYQDALKGLPEDIKKLNGKKVMMVGFMLPIDEVENIKEFLLVQSLWACCYGQPPDINGIVRVVMPGKQRTDYFFDPLKIVGTFKVEATVLEGYCVDIYQLDVESIEALK